MDSQDEKKLTANQLYKKYREDGGVLNFSEWLTREKTKGVFLLNGSINDEINAAIEEYKKEEYMKKTILGFPVNVLLISGIIIVGSILAYKYIKK